MDGIETAQRGRVLTSGLVGEGGSQLNDRQRVQQLGGLGEHVVTAATDRSPHLGTGEHGGDQVRLRLSAQPLVEGFALGLVGDESSQCR